MVYQTAAACGNAQTTAGNAKADNATAGATMTGQPIRNSYLRSEIATFVRTLAMLAKNAPDDRYALGWLEALAALASLAGVDAAHITDHASRITNDDRRLP